MENPISSFELQMPDSLIQSEAISQIDGTNGTVMDNLTANYLEIFDQKHAIQKITGETDFDENEAEPELVLQDSEDKFYGTIINTLRENTGIMIDTSNGKNNQDIKAIYSMFIFRRHKNLVEFILQYIMSNKAQLASQFNDDSLTNMSVKSARKQFKTKIDATIAVHCYEIIDNILSNDELMNPEVFISMLYQSNPEDYDYLVASSMYNTLALSFDVPKYIQHIRDIYSIPLNDTYLKSTIMELLIPTFKTNEQSIY